MATDDAVSCDHDKTAGGTIFEKRWGDTTYYEQRPLRPEEV
jgi:hypothetical protein